MIRVRDGWRTHSICIRTDDTSSTRSLIVTITAILDWDPIYHMFINSCTQIHSLSLLYCKYPLQLVECSKWLEFRSVSCPNGVGGGTSVIGMTTTEMLRHILTSVFALLNASYSMYFSLLLMIALVLMIITQVELEIWFFLSVHVWSSSTNVANCPLTRCMILQID